MQTEEALDTSLDPVDLRPVKTGSRRKGWLISIQAVMFLLGVSLLAFVIYRLGYESVLESLRRVGWGFFAIVALNQSRHFLRALTLYLAVAPEHRTFKYRSAVAARFGGEAVNLFSFVGPFLGDATKAVLLRKNLPLTHGASAVIIDNILYYVTVIIIILAGIVTLLATYGSGDSTMNRILLGIAIVAALLFAGLTLAILYQVTPVSHAIDFLAKRNLTPAFLVKKRQNILDVESNVFQFYQTRRADFVKVFAISLGVHAISVTEVYCALAFLGQDAYVSTAFIIESLTKVINATFSFIPGTIGVYEGGNGLILKTLGYTTAVGVALALVRRGAILFSTLIGITILLWRGAETGARRLAKNRDGNGKEI
ncbi:MAG: lysylphosphatidylglycerol synthase domain-containing protein [Pyrinomonadaceae bacterium]